MTEVEVVARYVREGLSPFAERFGQEGDFGSIRGMVDENISWEELERYAKESTPKGYEFIKVEIEER